MDDITSIDLRFVKDFVFRTVQCLASFEKWEKLLSVSLKFNAMTRFVTCPIKFYFISSFQMFSWIDLISYKFAEYLSPVIINAQQKLLRQLELSGNQTQPHFERLQAELGKYPRIEDLFFLNFKSEIDLDRLKKLDAEIKLDGKSSKYLSESFLHILFSEIFYAWFLKI